MKQKIEIEVEVPDGMEIDRENTTFKFKPKDITYDDIEENILYNTSVSVNEKYKSKCVVFRKLLEVADYLNNDWKPNWENETEIKFFIVYSPEADKFEIGFCSFISEGVVYFSSKENALRAIDIIGKDELKEFFPNKK